MFRKEKKETTPKVDVAKMETADTSKKIPAMDTMMPDITKMKMDTMSKMETVPKMESMPKMDKSGIDIKPKTEMMDSMPKMDKMGMDTMPKTGMMDLMPQMETMHKTGMDSMPKIDKMGMCSKPKMDTMPKTVMMDSMPKMDKMGMDAMPKMDKMGVDTKPKTGMMDSMPKMDKMGMDTMTKTGMMDSMPKMDKMGMDSMSKMDKMGVDTMLKTGMMDSMAKMDKMGMDTMPKTGMMDLMPQMETMQKTGMDSMPKMDKMGMCAMPKMDTMPKSGLMDPMLEMGMDTMQQTGMDSMPKMDTMSKTGMMDSMPKMDKTQKTGMEQMLKMDNKMSMDSMPKMEATMPKMEKMSMDSMTKKETMSMVDKMTKVEMDSMPKMDMMEDTSVMGRLKKMSAPILKMAEKTTKIESTDTTGQVIKCRAAVAWGLKEPLTIEMIEVAPPKKHEVRIKMVATGICHSDAHYLNFGGKGCPGVFPDPAVFPSILGHEGAGVVESVGSDVTMFKKGDHVIPLYVPNCGECSACMGTKTNFCIKNMDTQSMGLMTDKTTRFTCKGKMVYHFMGCSTFSEYTVVNDINLSKIDSKAPMDKVCIIGCAIPTGFGAALNAAKVERGSKCAVWGMGAIGLAAVMGCKYAGASEIIGIDVNSGKKDMAKKFGCSEFLNPLEFPKRTTESILLEKTKGGLDYTIECCGTIQTMRSALESTCQGGGVAVLVGISSTGEEMKTMPYTLLSGRTLKGTLFGGYKGRDDLKMLVDMYMRKEIMVDEFITHTMPLDKINDAFTLMREGKSVRSVAVMSMPM